MAERSMRGGLTVIKLAVLWICLLSQPVTAQETPCGDRREIADNLMAKFNERAESYGITTSGRLVELFVSKAGSWTLVLSYPNGRACLMTSGEGWQARPPGEPI